MLIDIADKCKESLDWLAGRSDYTLGRSSMRHFVLFMYELAMKKEILYKIREDTTWNNVKKIIKDKALPFTLEVAKTIGTDLLAVSMKATLNL